MKAHTLDTLRAKIGKRIRKRRLELKLTQDELAKKCGLTIAWVSNYECKERVPNLLNLIRLSIALKTSINYLVGLAED